MIKVSSSRFILVLTPLGSALMPFLVLPIANLKFSPVIGAQFLLQISLASLCGSSIMLGLDVWTSRLASKGALDSSLTFASTLLYFWLPVFSVVSFFVSLFLGVDFLVSASWLLASPCYAALQVRSVGYRFSTKPFKSVITIWALQLLSPLVAISISTSYATALLAWVMILIFVAAVSTRIRKANFNLAVTVAQKTKFLGLQSLLFPLIPNVERTTLAAGAAGMLVSYQNAWTVMSVPVGFVIAINNWWAVEIYASEHSANDRHPKISFFPLALSAEILQWVTFWTRDFWFDFLKLPPAFRETTTSDMIRLSPVPLFLVLYLLAANYMARKLAVKAVPLLVAGVAIVCLVVAGLQHLTDNKFVSITTISFGALALLYTCFFFAKFPKVIPKYQYLAIAGIAIAQTFFSLSPYPLAV